MKSTDIPKAFPPVPSRRSSTSQTVSCSLIDTAFFPLCCTQIICQIHITHGSKSRPFLSCSILFYEDIGRFYKVILPDTTPTLHLRINVELPANIMIVWPFHEKTEDSIERTAQIFMDI